MAGQLPAVAAQELEGFCAALHMDPSWLPRILAVLRREHAAAWEAAVSTAIQDNADELVARAAAG